MSNTVKRKVIDRVPAKGGKFLVKLECGSKRYTKSETVKELICEKSDSCDCFANEEEQSNGS